MTRRFAEGTSVSVHQTRAEIEDRLRKAGAQRIVHMDEPVTAIVMFMLAGRLVRIEVPIGIKATDQRRRSTWRALGLVIKAKLEAVALGITTVEQEWLAHVVLPDNRTVAQWIEPDLKLAYEQGKMPTSPLLLEGPRDR